MADSSDPLDDGLSPESKGLRHLSAAEREAASGPSRTTSIVDIRRAAIVGAGTMGSGIAMAYCYGFGFPRHRGGPMFYADTIGLPAVLTRVNRYRARFGDYWRPAPLLERLVGEGRGFFEP
ncbi:MAG: hypothetical protein ABJC89_14790 [Acidobacteriota bacterium]